jgi:hypothetical protein
MSKVIVIKGADFSANSIATTQIGVDNPTISISLEGVVTITPASETFLTYYTTDGTIPTSSSTLYSSPFSVTDNTIVKAVSYSGSISSVVTSVTYNAPLYSLTNATTFSGTTQLDTGVTTYYNTNDYTFLIDLNPTGYATGQTIAGIMLAAGIRIWYRNENEFKMGKVSDDTNQLVFADDNNILPSGYILTGTRIKIAVTYDHTTKKVRHYNSRTQIWKEFTDTSTPLNDTYELILGGFTSDSTAISYPRKLVGTIYSAYCLGNILNDNSITDWVNG